MLTLLRRSRPVYAGLILLVIWAGLVSRSKQILWPNFVTAYVGNALWLDAIRHTLPGALVLGQGFLWSDLVCYAAGVALGMAFERQVAFIKVSH